MPFAFNSKVNPKKPLDLTDPPPLCWTDIFDARDERKNLYGDPSSDFVRCREWEKRELERIERRDARRDKKKKKVA